MEENEKRWRKMEGHEKIMRKLRDMRKPVKRVAKIGKLYGNYENHMKTIS